MAKKTYPALQAGIEGWDALLTGPWRDLLQGGPLPVYEPAGGLLANLPAAAQNDRALAFVNDATAGWIPVYSNGTTWLKVPTQAASQANSAAGTVGALVTDFNALLAKLRTAGVLAP